MKVTAKLKMNWKGPVSDGQQSLVFGPDYESGRNKEWAKYTPGLSLAMNVLESVADLFEIGQTLTMTLENSEYATNDRIDIIEDSIGEFRWHRVAGNNEIISQGEGYTTHSGAFEGAIRANPGLSTAHFKDPE